MALAPGETSESFIREVDENLRRSKAEQFMQRWGKWLIVAAVLLIVGIGAYLYWQNRQAEKAAADSETFNTVVGGIGQRPAADIARQLDSLAAGANDSMAASARMTRAALALQNGDRASAVAQYRAVSEDKGAPETYRDAATLRLTQLEFDSLKPEDVIARLQPLAQKDNAWFGSAGEITALAMLKSNRRSEAARLLTAISAERTVPASIRARTGELAGTLAVPAAPATPAGQAAPR